MKQFDNFLPGWLHKKVNNQLLDPMVNWNYPSSGGKDGAGAFFTQPFNITNNTNNWHGTDTLIYALDYWLDANKDIFQLEYLHRCMVNFYTAGQNTGWHQDMYDEGYYSLLYYVNDADGGTQFKDATYKHKENSALFFDCRIDHCPITSTVPRRVSANWILKGKLLN